MNFQKHIENHVNVFKMFEFLIVVQIIHIEIRINKIIPNDDFPILL